MKRIEFWCAGTDPAVFKPWKMQRKMHAVFMANMGKMNRGREALQGPRNKFIMTLARSHVHVHLFGKHTEVQARMHGNLHAHGYVSGGAFARACSQAKLALGYGVHNVRNYIG